LSASKAGTVLERYVSGGTAEESRVTAEVVLQDSTGATRTFPPLVGNRIGRHRGMTVAASMLGFAIA
jgi:hypothetical protein